MKKLISAFTVAFIMSASAFSAFSQEAPRDKQAEAISSRAITAPEKPAGNSTDAAVTAPEAVIDNKILSEKLPNDLVLGEAKAPIKIVEYASLSCIHCKHFHDDVFYELKKRFIDTGKVQFTYRHFPLNGPATKAALIVNCAPDDSKLAFISALFKSQAQWAFVDNESEMQSKLRTISKIGGMDDAKFDSCFADEKKQDEVLALMKRAYDELKVETTPSIFIDGIRFDGARTIESFAEVINDKLQKKKD